METPKPRALRGGGNSRRSHRLTASCCCGNVLQALSDVDEEDENFAAMDGTREVVVDGDGLVTLCPDLGYYDRPALAGRGDNHGAAGVPTNMQARYRRIALRVLWNRPETIVLQPVCGAVPATSHCPTRAPIASTLTKSRGRNQVATCVRRTIRSTLMGYPADELLGSRLEIFAFLFLR